MPTSKQTIERLDLRRILERAEARDEFLRALNRLRPAVVDELRRDLRQGEKSMDIAHGWARAHNLSVQWMLLWASVAISEWQSVRAVRGKRRDPRADRPAAFFEIAMEACSGEALDLTPLELRAAERLDRTLTEDNDIKGPDPLRESRAEAITRMADAFDAEVRDLITDGFARAKIRTALETHAAWLVRHQVPPWETANKIARWVGGYREQTRKDIPGDSSTVTRAINNLAELIELPLRPSRGRPRPTMQ